MKKIYRYLDITTTRGEFSIGNEINYRNHINIVGNYKISYKYDMV